MLDVKSAVKNCKQCLRHDGDSVRAPLVPIEATGPNGPTPPRTSPKSEVSGDREKELKKKPKVVNVLVVTDHFTPTHHGLRDRRYDCSYCGPMSCTTTIFTSLGTPLHLMTR